mmetsp:Transcript_54110/g.124032  ORF Transcript_54110/g.124032 Transcript_54110/m.124032 type:complete len:383 (-) Transcript_54110:32-1180(-)
MQSTMSFPTSSVRCLSPCDFDAENSTTASSFGADTPEIMITPRLEELSAPSSGQRSPALGPEQAWVQSAGGFPPMPPVSMSGYHQQQQQQQQVFYPQVPGYVQCPQGYGYSWGYPTPFAQFQPNPAPAHPGAAPATAQHALSQETTPRPDGMPEVRFVPPIPLQPHGGVVWMPVVMVPAGVPVPAAGAKGKRKRVRAPRVVATEAPPSPRELQAFSELLEQEVLTHLHISPSKSASISTLGNLIPAAMSTTMKQYGIRMANFLTTLEAVEILENEEVQLVEGTPEPVDRSWKGMRRGDFLTALRSGDLEEDASTELYALLEDTQRFLLSTPDRSACTTNAGNKLSARSRRFLKQYRVRLSQLLREFGDTFVVEYHRIALKDA